MARRIGYSLVKLNTGTEEAWTYSLPWTLTYTVNETGNPTGTVTLDKVGLEIPRRENPTHRLVERWCTDDVPLDNVETGFENPTFDGTQVNVTGVYVPVDPVIIAEAERKKNIEEDSGTVFLLDKLRTATNAQIDSYIQTNVTDLASAKQVLARIVKVLVRLI